MKDKKNYKRRTVRMLIAGAVLAVLLLILLLIRTNVAVSEWLAVHVSRFFIVFASKITGIFPFSVYELFLYVAIISILALFITWIVFMCKKQRLRSVTYLLVIVIMVLSFADVYTLTAGFAYNRDRADVPLSETTRIEIENIDEVVSLARFMMKDFNELAAAMERDEDGRTISPYTHAELAALMKEEFKRLKGGYFSDFTPRAKMITSKNIMTHMHITGVFFAPFGEANVNPLTPASQMPVTMAHELAHSKGAMRESDANLVAYWLTVTSDDDYLRYSGYISCYSRILAVVRFFDSTYKTNYMSSIPSVDPVVNAELIADSKFWAEYDLLDKITEAFNNLYLKLQGQKEGTGSYVEPTLPPDVSYKPGGGEGEGEVEKAAYNLNNLQRMLLKAIGERMDSSQ